MQFFFLITLLWGVLHAQNRATRNVSIFRQAEINRNFQTAFSLYSKNNYELSIDYYRKALELNPSDSNIRYLLGLAYYAAGYTQNAVLEWENLMKLNGVDAVLEEKIAVAHQLQFLQRSTSVAPSRKLNLLKRIDLLDIKGAIDRGLRIILPTAITVDKGGVITVMDGKTGAIVQMNGNGVQIRNVLGFYKQSFFPTSVINRPYDFIRQDNGNYFISDFRSDSVVQLTPIGEEVAVWNKSADFPVSFRGPKGLAFDADGNILIADSGTGVIKVMNQEGELVNSFGTFGTYAGQLKLPSDVYFSSFNSNIYVVDAGNKRLQSFDRYGSFVEEISLSKLNKPSRIFRDSEREDSFMLLDKTQLYRFYIPTGQLFPVLVDEDIGVRKPRNYLSATLDPFGKAYIGNAETGTLDVFGAAAYLYENLKVHTQKIDLDNFPTVIMQVSVKNFDGYPVGKMKVNDFEVFENNVKRPLRRIKRSEQKSKFRPVVLVEKTSESFEKRRRVENFLKNFFGRTETIDRVQLIGFGADDVRNAGEVQTISTFTKLFRVAINKLLEQPFYKQNVAGAALQQAISLSLGHAYKRAVVLFTFSDYDSLHLGGENYQTLIDYAAHNQIPIYVVDANVSSARVFNKNAYLQNIAQLSGGEYFRFDSKVVDNLLQAMRENENGVYELAYTTGKVPLSEGIFRSVEVRANFQGLSGVDDKSGYPIP